MTYALSFIRRAFGCPLPDYINLDLLFNVAYCLDNSKIKLYILADEKSFLYKCDQNGNIARQHDAAKSTVDMDRLDSFLGCRLNYNDLIIDTVEENIFYIYCEESGFEQQIRLLESLQTAYRIDTESFFQAVSRLNDRSISSYSDLYDHKAVSMVKISLRDRNFKIYTRPFKTGNNFILPAAARDFLCGVYQCGTGQLADLIRNLWVAYNFDSGQTVISTQNDELKKLF